MHVASLIDSSTCISCMFLCYMYVCVYMYMYSHLLHAMKLNYMYMYEECKYSVRELVLMNKFISRAARKYDVARLCQQRHKTSRIS